MGFQNFLLRLDLKEQNQTPEVLRELRETSIVFVESITNKDIEQANIASIAAMKCFDYVIGEILRARDSKQYPSDSDFVKILKEPGAIFVAVPGEAEQRAVRSAGPGRWRHSKGSLVFDSISVEETLNKIKHRHPHYGNFRIDSGKHIFVVCSVKGAGRPPGITEVDVQALCDQCDRVAAVMAG